MTSQKINIEFGWESCHPLGRLDTIFHSGQLYCFIGNNGTGKSTLYKTLLGITKPISGVVPKSFSDSAVLVSDYVNTPKEGKVSSLVKFASLNTEATSSLQCDEFNAFIHDIWDNKLSTLSSGQRKILELYIAFINEKQWFVFDEASNALDRKNRTLLFKYIDVLIQSNRGVIYTTHNLEEVVLLGGNVYVLKGKGIVEKFSDDDMNLESLGRAMED